MNIVDQLLKIALLGAAWVLYLLIVISVASIAVMIERWWFFRKNKNGGEGLREEVLRVLRRNDDDAVDTLLRKGGSVEGRVVANAWAFRDGGGEAISHALESELSIARRELERGLNFLGTIGNNGPFIGLLGTVIGVIGAFRELGSDAARSGAMGNVMSGIAEALVATGVGLFVALPAVVAYNVLQKKINEIEQDAISLGRAVTAWTEVRARGGSIREAEGATPAEELASQAHGIEEREEDASAFVAAVDGGE